MATRNSPPPEFDLIVLVQALSRMVAARIMAEISVAGVRESDGYIFQHLVPGPMPIKQLAERLGVSQQAASKTVAGMEQRGLVHRRTANDDARVHLVELTSQADQVIEDARATRRAVVAEIQQLLGPNRSRQFERDIGRIIDHFDGRTALNSRALPLPS